MVYLKRLNDLFFGGIVLFLEDVYVAVVLDSANSGTFFPKQNNPRWLAGTHSPMQMLDLDAFSLGSFVNSVVNVLWGV